MSEKKHAIRESSEKLVELITSSIVLGEAQAGEWAMDGDTYNAMMPFSVDTRAIADGVVDLIDKFIHTGKVKRLPSYVRIDSPHGAGWKGALRWCTEYKDSLPENF